MTDPNAFVTGQLGQQAQTVTGAVASQEDIAQAAQAQAGSGVTEADLDAIRAQLADFARQLAAQAATTTAGPDTLTQSVASLTHYLEGHGDPAALELGKDATEAAAAAASSGNTGALSAIVAKIEAHLRRNPPYPGENFHYSGALDTASHLPVVIDRFQPPSAAVAVASDRAPAKVVAGSVVG